MQAARAASAGGERASRILAPAACRGTCLGGPQAASRIAVRSQKVGVGGWRQSEREEGVEMSAPPAKELSSSSSAVCSARPVASYCLRFDSVDSTS